MSNMLTVREAKLRSSLPELQLKGPDGAARSEALVHLDVAIPELRDMKMRPFHEHTLPRANISLAASSGRCG